MILDVISTKIALSRGFSENNPLMRSIVENTLLFIFVKLFVSGVIIIMIKKCINIDRKAAEHGMRILVLMMLCIVIGNIYTISARASSNPLVGNDIFNETFGFSGGASNNSDVVSYDSLGIIQAPNNNYSVTNISINFTNIKNPGMYRIIGIDDQGATFQNNSIGVVNQRFASVIGTMNDSFVFDGSIGWERVGSSANVYYTIYFNSFNTTLSNSLTNSKMINLSYDTKVFSDSIVRTAGAAGDHYQSINSDFLVMNINTQKGAAGGYQMGYLGSASNPAYISYSFDDSMTFVVRNESSQIMRIIALKNNYNFRIDMYNRSSSYLYMSEISPNNFNISFIKFGGLQVYIYSVSAQGGVNRTILDAQNQLEIPTTTPTRETPPSGANIYTDKNSYVVGDNIYIEWFVADDPYNNLLSDCEFVVNDETLANSINQHDNYTIISPGFGIKQIQIVCGVFSNTVAGEKTVNVYAESQSYITIQNNTARAGSLNNFTYKWGFTPSSFRWLNIYKFNTNLNSWVKESSNSIQSASQANVIYNSSVLIKSDGRYYAELCDNNRECPVARVLFSSIYEANVPIQNYGFSNISITSYLATYAQNDWLSFNTRIDGTNYSSGLSFSVRLYNPSTTTTKTLQYIHNEYEDNNVYLDSAMEPGTQKLQLIGTNASGTYILNQTDITISVLDANGFALYADKYNNVCPKESVVITGISPQNSTLTVSTVPIRRYNFSGSKTIEIKSSQDYTVSLDTQGTQNKLISIYINASCVLNPIASPTTPTTPQTMNNLVSFLSLPAFWGILLFIGCVIGVAWRAPSTAGIVALIVSNLEAIVGLWSPYTIYVFIVTWIIAAIYFTLGRNTTTGGK